MATCPDCMKEVGQVTIEGPRFMDRIPNGIGHRGGVERYEYIIECKCECGIRHERRIEERPYV